MDRNEALQRSRREDGQTAAAQRSASARPSGLAATTGRRLGLLRQATSDIHAATERTVEAQGFFQSPRNYAIYLRRLAAFHHAYDRAAGGLDTSALRLFQIDKHECWLRQDLASLGIADAAGEDARTTWRLPNTSALLGSLYVLAGSSLGARVLHRITVERALPGPGGSSYLAALAGALRWTDAVAYIESVPHIQEDAMMAGAVDTFEMIGRYLAGEVEA